jgi:hypothetical protein
MGVKSISNPSKLIWYRTHLTASAIGAQVASAPPSDICPVGHGTQDGPSKRCVNEQVVVVVVIVVVLVVLVIVVVVVVVEVTVVVAVVVAELVCVVVAEVLSHPMNVPAA